MIFFPQINLVKCLFSLVAFGTLVLSIVINLFERLLPKSIVQAFRYGKFSYMYKNSIVNYFELPKSFFRHFYIIATIYSFYAISELVEIYMLSGTKRPTIVPFLDAISSKNTIVSVSATNTFIAVSLLCIQIWRRLYETCIVSVFSNSKINIVHYVIGIFHYLGAITAILIEAPGFTIDTPLTKNLSLSVNDVKANTFIGIIIFFWAWYHQFQAALILANLRKNESGKVVTYGHRIPMGGLFNLLSSPHMFCEMIMYFGLGIILWGHGTWPYVFLWVFINQSETALLSHWWYIANFKNYPNNRKAFIPFIV